MFLRTIQFKMASTDFSENDKQVAAEHGVYIPPVRKAPYAATYEAYKKQFPVTRIEPGNVHFATTIGGQFFTAALTFGFAFKRHFSAAWITGIATLLWTPIVGPLASRYQHKRNWEQGGYPTSWHDATTNTHNKAVVRGDGVIVSHIDSGPESFNYKRPHSAIAVRGEDGKLHLRGVTWDGYKFE